jgi:hypothetical protein
MGIWLIGCLEERPIPLRRDPVQATRMNTETERVRRHTARDVNERIDDEIANAVFAFEGASNAELTERIEELDREWDIERVLQTNASALALAGVVLAATRNPRWLLLSGGVLGFLFLHGTQGWCPPLPTFRRMGIRTRSEIDRERFALRFLRGDFDEIGRTRHRAERIVEALANGE